MLQLRIVAAAVAVVTVAEVSLIGAVDADVAVNVACVAVVEGGAFCVDGVLLMWVAATEGIVYRSLRGAPSLLQLWHLLLLHSLLAVVGQLERAFRACHSHLSHQRRYLAAAVVVNTYL